MDFKFENVHIKRRSLENLRFIRNGCSKQLSPNRDFPLDHQTLPYISCYLWVLNKMKHFFFLISVVV